MKLYEFVCQHLDPDQAAKLNAAVASLVQSRDETRAAFDKRAAALRSLGDLAKELDTGPEFKVWYPAYHGHEFAQGTAGTLLDMLEFDAEVTLTPGRDAVLAKIATLEAERTTLDVAIMNLKLQLEAQNEAQS